MDFVSSGLAMGVAPPDVGALGEVADVGGADDLVSLAFDSVLEAEFSVVVVGSLLSRVAPFVADAEVAPAAFSVESFFSDFAGTLPINKSVSNRHG